MGLVGLQTKKNKKKTADRLESGWQDSLLDAAWVWFDWQAIPDVGQQTGN